MKQAYRNILIFVILILIAGGVYLYFRTQTKVTPVYTTTEVTFGVVEETVSSTGTLDAVGTVDVGTQTSGTIATLRADYNDKVRKGQIIAELDRTALSASFDEAKAAVVRSEAQLQNSQVDLERSQKLFALGHISEKELTDAKATVAINNADLLASQAGQKRAETNLANTTIRSPINGTVIARSAEVGATVAASLSSPTLFVIAEDLARMEILANVDESDIGTILVGQKARFSVQAYPDSTFHATVRQIRLKPTVSQNVVNYTVVLDAPNPQMLLLPGMTATVAFVVQSSDSSLIIPVSSLSFRPDSIEQQRPARHEGKLIWVLNAQKQPEPRHVKIGLSDGAHTAILKSPDLKVGEQVITSVKNASSKISAKSTERKSSAGGGMFGMPHGGGH